MMMKYLLKEKVRGQGGWAWTTAEEVGESLKYRS